jgi:hypothetical protein
MAEIESDPMDHKQRGLAHIARLRAQLREHEEATG